MTSDLNESPGAWHGIALNRAFPLEDRLAASLKACDLYERRLEAYEPVVRAAEHVYTELIRLGTHAVGEASSLERPTIRSDKWPPEIDLMVAVERLQNKKITDDG